MKRRAVVAVVLVVAVAAGVFYAVGRPAAAGQLTASGTLEVDEVSVGPETAGRVVDLLVDEGQRVAVGQVVARLDDSVLRVQMKQADPAQRQLLDVQQDKLTLRAPIAGDVLKRVVNRGEVVAAGAPVVTLADQSQLKLTLYIPEADLGRVRPGQLVQVRVDAFPGRPFGGEVRSIATRAEFTPRNVQTARDRQALVFAVKVRVPNPTGELRAGLPADATFQD